ncbi:hypothetical protein HK101_003376, partial [Irineochytrium annulatum]
MNKANSVSGVMDMKFYSTLIERGKQFATFILPLPRTDGYEFFFMQIADKRIYYTPLIEYKAKQEYARPCLVITHFDELGTEKGVVLMQGELMTNTINENDAKLLIYLTQAFYVTGTKEKLNLVELFHREPATFNYQ